MAAIKNVMIDIQNDIIMGVLGFKSIAEKHGVSMYEVNVAWNDLCEQEAAMRQERDDEVYGGYEDEEYIPDPDSWYEDQYDLGDY
jgi:hypothetical protein